MVFPAQAIKYDEYGGVCQLAISKECKPELVTGEIFIPSGYGFTSEQLAEVRIIPACGQLWAEYVYKTESQTANILKKVAIQLGVSLAEVGREALTLPKRYDLSCLNKSYRKRCEARLKTA